MKKISKQDLIDEILDQFNFERVHKVMEALNWWWYGEENGVPNIAALRKKARELLKDCADSPRKNYYCSIGGFAAEKQEGDTLILEFIIADWRTWDSYDPAETEISWD